GTFQNITHRVEAESERDNFFALSVDLLCIAHHDGRLLKVNPAWTTTLGFESTLGFEKSDLEQVRFTELVHPEELELVQAELQLLKASQKSSYFQARFRCKGGEWKWIEWNIEAAYYDNKKFYAVGRDITDRKRTEKSLRDMNIALRESNQELKQFAYVASHDLQTPLRSIAGFAHFLKDDYHGKIDATADDYIDRIIAGCERQRILINDLLTYSRLENGTVRQGEVDLNKVLSDVLEAIKLTIEEAKAAVTSDELPTVLGDESQMFQVLQNLIENGIKYNKSGDPRIHLSAKEENGEWLISIRDNGIGIELEQQTRIFEIFRRLHTQQEYSGTGIGLALCRKIVQRHQGKIWVNSEAGAGSTFHFTLPVPKLV
ncbi:MAG: histidine kinase, partial [Planctomyces sp.]|nr:histidine kinase [Planctomyces sp.]